MHKMAIILRIKRPECEIDNTDTYAVNTSASKNLGIRKKVNQELDEIGFPDVR
jgi:hypothetical protein